MDRGPVRSRRVRSGEGDEGDEEGAAGLEEDGGVVMTPEKGNDWSARWITTTPEASDLS